MKTIIALLSSVLLLGLSAMQASATTTYTLTGSNTTLTGPFAQVLITRIDNTHATVEVDRLGTYLFGEVGLSTSGGSAFASGWDQAGYSEQGPKNLDGFGSYNSVSFEAPDGFANAYTVLHFLLTNTSGTDWTSDTEVLTANNLGRFAAVHIFNIDGSVTGFASTGGSVPPVPEPTTLLLLGAGLIGIAVCKKRQNAASV